MKATNKTTGLIDRRVMLSTLWVFAMFTYVYADILTLYFGSALQPGAWTLEEAGQQTTIVIGI